MSRGPAPGCSGDHPEPAASARRPLRARDVMISDPKTLPADATVNDARRALADDHTHMILLTDGGKLCGTLTRRDLVPAPAGERLALAFSDLHGRTVPPDTPLDRLQELLHHEGTRRLAVISGDQALLGLVCLKRSRAGFCSDADVASRAADVLTTTNGETT